MKFILTFLGFISIGSILGQELQRCDSSPSRPQTSLSDIKSYPRDNIEIPVVFHIVWHIGTENLNDDLIFAQLDVINKDYNALNKDLASVPSDFKKQIGNPSISFCLATEDPNGSLASGIVRRSTGSNSIAGKDQLFDGRRRIKNTSLGGSDPWDTNKYMNIWIGNRGDGLLGDATFPNDEDPDSIDGVVIDYKAIGVTEASNSPFNLGRTLTHEIGHYLNVFHLSGSETGCFTDDDLVEDTPNQFDEYFGTCGEEVSSCDSRDMDQNFMSFRNDACLLFFTKGQVARMMETLFTTRLELISSQTCSDSNPIPQDPLKFARIYTMADQIEISLLTLRNREYNLELYDVTGRFVWQQTHNPAHTYRIKYADHSTGIYFLKLNIEGRSVIRKVYLN